MSTVCFVYRQQVYILCICVYEDLNVCLLYVQAKGGTHNQNSSKMAQTCLNNNNINNWYFIDPLGKFLFGQLLDRT